MVLLVALLLAFLAQNLLTPYPLDFTAAGTVVVSLALCIPGAAWQRRLSAPWLVILLIVLIGLWQLAPPSVAGTSLFALAAALFVWETWQPIAGAGNSAAVETKGPEGKMPAAPRAWKTWALVALIVALSAVLCLYDNGNIQPGLHGDEAESGIEARNLLAGKYTSLIGVGWYDQPLASFALQALGLRLFGDTISGLRTASAIVSLLTLPLVFLLARQMFNQRIALLAVALMALSHWFIAYARLGINYNQALLLQLIAVLGFWRGWQARDLRWFAVSGAACGLGLYGYFASRLVPVLLLAFAGFLWLAARRRALRADASPAPAQIGMPQLAMWAGVMLLIFAPMGAFFIEHRNEFNSRAAFVFLFSDTQWNTREEKLRMYTGTTDAPTALAVQVTRYAALFNVGGARDGQYGNTLSLLDYYTAVFFVLGLAFALARFREPRFALLLGWLVLTVGVGGVLTIESPFTPRLIGMMPVPFLLAAVALDAVWIRLRALLAREPAPPNASRAERITARAVPFLPHAAIGLLLVAAAYFNYWAYFERYIHSIDGWAQREPATSIARYAAQLAPDQTLYVLGAPELFVWHGTIKFIAPRLRGFDLLNPADDLPVRDPQTARATFVVLPSYARWLEDLKTYYPQGVRNDMRRPWGEIWYTLYEVSAEEIMAKR